jgi:hypothetical protein
VVLSTPIFAAPIEQAQNRRYGPHMCELPHMQSQELWCHRRVIFLLQRIFANRNIKGDMSRGQLAKVNKFAHDVEKSRT